MHLPGTAGCPEENVSAPVTIHVGRGIDTRPGNFQLARCGPMGPRLIRRQSRIHRDMLISEPRLTSRTPYHPQVTVTWQTRGRGWHCNRSDYRRSDANPDP